MPDRIARAVSILGHPLLTLPAALAAIALSRGDRGDAAPVLLGGFAVFAALVMGLSWRQVRQGRWAHVDASDPAERRALNRGLLPALAVGALVAWRFAAQADLAIALALAAGIVLMAMASARVCKLSLHAGFAVFAAGLLWPLGAPSVAAGLAFAAAVAWSRLRLSRHRPRDLLAGALAGAAAALVHACAQACVQAGTVASLGARP